MKSYTNICILNWASNVSYDHRNSQYMGLFMNTMSSFPECNHKLHHTKCDWLISKFYYEYTICNVKMLDHFKLFNVMNLANLVISSQIFILKLFINMDIDNRWTLIILEFMISTNVLNLMYCNVTITYFWQYRQADVIVHLTLFGKFIVLIMW